MADLNSPLLTDKMPAQNPMQDREEIAGANVAANRFAEKPPRKRRRRLFWIVLIALAIGIYGMIQKHCAAEKQTAVAHQGTPPIPVVAAAVSQKDIPIYLDGLGTVQALNTVTIRARVDGQLEKVAFAEGQDVHAGDVLAQIDPAPFQAQLQQAQAKQNQDAAQLANAQLDLTRDTDLLARKVIAPQQFDTQKALVAQLDAAVKADEAAINSARVQLNYTTIVSPLDGRIGIRQVDQGNIVHASDANGLVVITQLHPLFVLFTLPQQNLGEVHQQMAQGELGVIALDRDNSTVLAEGKLSVIDNEIDTTTGTIKLKAIFPNDDLKLWPGQFVNARLHIATRKNGVEVPASVIQRGPNGAYAFVIKDDQTVEIRPVKVAQIDGGEALIDEGLQAGEQVVVDGQYKLQDGSQVKLAAPSAAKTKGAPAANDSELK